MAALPSHLAERWVWWRLGCPSVRNTDLASVLEPDDAVVWHEPGRTERLLCLMAPVHRARLEAQGGRAVGAVSRRTRVEAGRSVQRAEVRFDGLARRLRAPRGGSSLQAFVVEEDGQVPRHLLNAREEARLMGLPETYDLPPRVTAALHVAGDGVAVQMVRWLAQELLEPLLQTSAVMAAD